MHHLKQIQSCVHVKRQEEREGRRKKEKGWKKEDSVLSLDLMGKRCIKSLWHPVDWFFKQFCQRTLDAMRGWARHGLGEHHPQQMGGHAFQCGLGEIIPKRRAETWNGQTAPWIGINTELGCFHSGIPSYPIISAKWRFPINICVYLLI